MSIGKHYFHLKEYSILQLLYADTSPAYQNCWIEYSFSRPNVIQGYVNQQLQQLRCLCLNILFEMLLTPPNPEPSPASRRTNARAKVSSETINFTTP